MQSREELFELAKQNRAREKAEQEANTHGDWSYEKPEYCALSADQMRIVRFLGLPLLDGRHMSSPTDAHEFMLARIMADDGKLMRVVFPKREEEKGSSPNDWILWRIRDKVLTVTWKRDETGQRVRNYVYAKAHPETFQRVRYNGVTDPMRMKYERGWTPTDWVMLNVIDRQDNWCKENRHSKLLSGRASKPTMDGTVFYDPGIKKNLYLYLFDNVVAYENRPWDEYDIALQTLKAAPWYVAYSCDGDRRKIPVELQKFIVDSPLTDEERAYKLYDIESMTKVTTYWRIRQKLGNFIQRVDLDYGTHFNEELDSLCDDEKKRFAEEGLNEYGFKDEKVAVTKTAGVAPSAPAQPAQPEASLLNGAPVQNPASAQNVQVRTRAVSTSDGFTDWEGLTNGKYCYLADQSSADITPETKAKYNGKTPTVYKGIARLTDAEKAMVTGIDSNGQLLYKSTYADGSRAELLKDTLTGFMSPDRFKTDPLTGEDYS